MRRNRISDNTVRRLPGYLRTLDNLAAKGVDYVTSSKLGVFMGCTASQVRQDLNAFGKFGHQGRGYDVLMLRDEIRHILGADRHFPAIIVGAGRIGRALLDNFDFASYGVTIEAAFDIDLNLTDMYYQGVWIYELSDMDHYMKEHRIDMAVLCVPAESAQRMANYLVELGIRAIWNFSNDDLVIKSPGVILEDIKFSDSLLVIGYRLNARASRLETANANP